MCNCSGQMNKNVAVFFIAETIIPSKNIALSRNIGFVWYSTGIYFLLSKGLNLQSCNYCLLCISLVKRVSLKQPNILNKLVTVSHKIK